MFWLRRDGPKGHLTSPNPSSFWFFGFSFSWGVALSIDQIGHFPAIWEGLCLFSSKTPFFNVFFPLLLFLPPLLLLLSSLSMFHLPFFLSIPFKHLLFFSLEKFFFLCFLLFCFLIVCFFLSNSIPETVKHPFSYTSTSDSSTHPWMAQDGAS